MKPAIAAALLLVFSAGPAPAQEKSRPFLLHAEDFDPGHTMTYAVLKDSIRPGNTGRGVVWDFSNIKTANTVVQEILPASAVSSAKDYPQANTIERSSDGMLLFVEKTAALNQVWGLELGDLHLRYSVPYTFIRRPFAYGDSLGSEPRRSYEAYGGAQGTGRTRTVADGQGTLKLPTGTFEAIRVRFEQDFTDVGAQGSTKMRSVTYAWFDATHKGALLRLSSTTIENPYYNNKTTKSELLVRENGVAVKP